MEFKDLNGEIALATCSIEMHFLPDDAERAVRLLLSIVGLTQAKSGCLAAAVARDAVDENRLRYREEWERPSAFGRHVASEEFRRVLVAMDMCCEEPKVLIGSFSGSCGMSHLQKIRDRQLQEPDDGNEKP